METSGAILGRSVVQLGNGKRVGAVRSIAVDFEARRVSHLVVTSAVTGDALVLPLENALSFGDAFITTQGISDFLPTSDPAARAVTRGTPRLVGLNAYSMTGNLLGKITGFDFDTANGRIVRLHVDGKRSFSGNKLVSLTPEFAFLDDSIAPDAQRMLALASTSAADFYRRKFPGSLAPKPMLSPDRPCAYKSADIRALAPPWLDSAFTAPEGKRVHVVTRSAAERGSSRRIRAHVWSGDFPAGAFFEYGDDVVIASPEFTFLQLATELEFAQLVAYGYEICGFYSLSNDSPTGFCKRSEPLTSTAKLAAFMAGAEAMRGYRQAMNALPHVIDGSPSPDATCASIFACLSYHQGGYCMPWPVFGHQVKLGEQARLLAGESKMAAGICWPGARICLEIAESPDELRRSVLELSGYRVFALTRGASRDFNAFESFALELANALGKRIPGKKRGLLPQREHLRSEIFGWTDAAGHAHADTGAT